MLSARGKVGELTPWPTEDEIEPGRNPYSNSNDTDQPGRTLEKDFALYNSMEEDDDDEMDDYHATLKKIR